MTTSVLDAEFTKRLNNILTKLTSEEFLQSKGLGNEIAYYVFDYPPEQELRMRDHIDFLLERLPKAKPGIRVSHVNLFDLLLDHLKERGYLEKSYAKQKTQGDEKAFKALEAMLHEEKLAEVFVNAAQPESHDFVMVSGVGSAWPLLRTHALLNNLQPLMGDTPLVMFFPGHYDGKSLRLFGKLKNDNYYRAFKLVP